MSDHRDEPSSRREMWVSTAVLAGSALVVLLAAGRPRPGVDVAQPGGSVSPPAVALALVVLAAVATLSLLGRAGRRIVCTLIIAAGAGVIVTAGISGKDPSAAGWGWPGVAAGAVLVVAGGWAWLRCPSWPGARRAPVRAGTGRLGPSGAASTWDSLDRGEDPTA